MTLIGGLSNSSRRLAGCGPRLPLAPADYVPDRLRLTRTEPLAVGPSHALRAGSLPPLHRDPFDRMLVAQALCEEIPVLSSDHRLDAYGVRRLQP